MKRRKFYGWGFEGEGLSPDEIAQLRQSIAERYGVDELPEPKPPRAEDVELREPRLEIPKTLAGILTADQFERLSHSYGKSLPDAIRMFRRDVPHPPDLVAFPENESEVVAVLDWADGQGAAVIPYGGGTSVCGGVEPDVGGGYAGAVSLDLGRLDRVLEIDRTSRAARIQGGASCPVFEEQLKEHGLTLRHFPQSFLHATLGGMIATRSGGHYATLYTHIDDFVESVRTVTPQGVLESFRLPGSGAGPSPDRLMIGSEGILGVITEAWMRLQNRPTFRASAVARFDDFLQAAEAVRALSQSALFPSNCRLIDAREAANSGAGDGSSALLVLAFESADHELEPWIARAKQLVLDHGGQIQKPESDSAGAEDRHRKGAAGAWRDAFLRAPYFREVLTPMGVLGDTFETAVTWDRFPEFHRTVVERMTSVIEEVTGRPGTVTCRFTHAYPDGPAPYFTFQGLSTAGLESPGGMLEQWREIKTAANEVVVGSGGTVTHHHAVGRDHRPKGYDEQRPELFARALSAAKAALDPGSILNPGVLIDPPGRGELTGGVMAPPIR